MKKMAKIQSWLFIKRDSQIPICRSVAYTSWVAFQCNFATQCNPYRKLRLLPAKRQAKACLFAFLWIRKAALGNSPVDCCNRRGFSAEKRIHLPPSKIDMSRQRFVVFYLFTIHYSLFTIHSFAGLCLAFFVRIKYNVHIPTFESKERYS